MPTPTLSWSNVTCPLLFAPEVVTLPEIRVCTQYYPTHGPTSAVLVGYHSVKVVVLKTDLLYTLADHHMDLKVGQYLRRNVWLEEQLESDEPIYMLYDSLAEMIIGGQKAKNRYRFVEVPRFRQLGEYARALVWQSYCGRTNPETVHAMEAFVLSQPATMDDDLADALDTAYLLISDHDTTGRRNPRRKTLMGEAVLNVVDERMIRIDEAVVEVEECIYIGLDRMHQITSHLRQAHQVIGSRLRTEFDPSKCAEYAYELQQLGQQTQRIVDRPYVRMVGHLRNALWKAADLYRKHQWAEARQLLMIQEAVISFILDVYPALFNLRLAMTADAEAGVQLESSECIHYLRIIKSIRTRASQFMHDADLQGRPLAGPVLQNLSRADAELTDGFLVNAYNHVKQAAAGV